MKVVFTAQCGKPLHRLAAVPLPYKGEARLFLMLWRQPSCLPSSGEVAPKGSEGFSKSASGRPSPELPDDCYACGGEISLFGDHGFDPAFISAHLAGGGLMLGAFFMATDYVTRPVTKNGQYLYGVILGLLTGIFRIFGPSAEGVSYAIILGNLLVPLIEKVTMPKIFGKGGEKA